MGNCQKILLSCCKFQPVECWFQEWCITLGRYVIAKTWSMTLMSKVAYHFIPKPEIVSTYSAFHATGLFYQVYFSFSWSDITFIQVQKHISVINIFVSIISAPKNPLYGIHWRISCCRHVFYSHKNLHR